MDNPQPKGERRGPGYITNPEQLPAAWARYHRDRGCACRGDLSRHEGQDKAKSDAAAGPAAAAS